MQPNTLNTKILLYISVLFFLISSCKKGNDLENQITIKINSIDRETKQRRVNFFDTVEVRKEGFGFIKKTFPVEKIYIMDSMGSVKIKIDTTKIYDISVFGLGVLGGDMYFPGHLKEGQEVSIEVMSLEKR